MMHDNEFTDARHHINGFNLAQSGSGCVCRYNTIDSVFNGLYMSRGFDTSALYEPRYLRNMDYYGNTITNIADDGLEPEGAAMNLRIYGNRFQSVWNGFSDAPTTVGPIFFIRNTISDWGEGAIKSKYTSMLDEAPGFFYHNTCFLGTNSLIPLSTSMQDMRDTYKNNILVGGSYIMNFTETPVNILLDYNSLYLTLLGTNYYRASKFYCTAPDCLSPFTRGEAPDTAIRLETHGLFNDGIKRPHIADSVNVPYDFHLLRGAAEIDRGEIIPGINDDYSGAGPDIGAFEYTEIILAESPPENLPVATSLDASPNPFNPATQIRINLARASEMSLVIYDIQGRQVCVLEKGKLAAGRHHFEWNALSRASGIYFVRLTDGRALVHKAIELIR
jgi:hypothetical protein